MAKIKPIMALDTEDDSKGKPLLFNFYDGKKHHTFTDQEEAIDFVLNLKYDVDIWATNMSYDIGNLFKNHLDYLELYYAKSRFILAKIPRSKIFFKDTLNHWKISVKEMGKRIGLEKIEVEGNFNNIEYCQRDTEITYKFVKTMQENYHSIGAKLKSTIGSSSLALFQEKYYKKDLSKSNFTKEELEFLSQGVYGGRTEVFNTSPHTGRIFYSDFNSLYPSVMKGNWFPCLDKRKFVKKINLKNEGIAHVRVKSPDGINIPYLPYRGTSLYFPLGSFDGYYTYFEIREAIIRGYHIEKTYKALEFYGGKEKPFDTFIEDNYQKRLIAQSKNDKLLSDTPKLIMNNLFGKFSQSNVKTTIKKITENLRKTRVFFELDQNLALITDVGDYPKHSNFIWSAYVTAYARHKLYNALIQTDKKAELLYCDTDSIIYEADKPIFENSKELGELKLEYELKHAHFKGLKTYRIITSKNEEIVRVRGIPTRSAKEFFEKGIVTYRKPYRLREVLRRNKSKNIKKKLEINFWDEVTKVDRKNYDKRKVLKNGKTEPIRIK